MSSILISRAAPRTAVASAIVAGGSAHIAQTSYRQYATAKKGANSLPGAMTFTDALNVLKVNQEDTEPDSPPKIGELDAGTWDRPERNPRNPIRRITMDF